MYCEMRKEMYYMYLQYIMGIKTNNEAEVRALSDGLEL